MWKGSVVAIATAPAGAARMVRVSAARAVAGKGLEGDRYFAGLGTYSGSAASGRELTLIEREAIEALRRDYGIELDPEESRRNIVTSGVPLNHLVGAEFRVGECVLRGVRLCEPCSHLERLSQKGVARGLVHRGGLRCEIVRGGMIRVGDEIAPIP
jgi:MOSC domain-containing protein YiiM